LKRRLDASHQIGVKPQVGVLHVGEQPEGAGLEQRHGLPGFHESTRRRDARATTADHDGVKGLNLRARGEIAQWLRQ